MSQSKFHLTQSLLSAWQWSFKTEDGYESFLRALNRQKDPPTPAMLDGMAFESAVNGFLNGAPLDGISEPACRWIPGIQRTAEYLWGSQQQVSLSRDLIVDGVCFQLNGVLDFLRAGVIFDTKFSSNYHLNKYLDSPQHPTYFYLCPEAREFQYLSCDGKYVYREIYHPEDVRPIEHLVREFMADLDRKGLVDVYTSIWETNAYFAAKVKERGQSGGR